MKLLQAQISFWCPIEGTSESISFSITDKKMADMIVKTSGINIVMFYS
jgi:hypothetical protein